MTHTKPAHVFLCYAPEDKLRVREFFERLIKDGVDAWLDEEKLLPGQDRVLEISKAVKNSAAIIVFLSSHSVEKEGFIQKEIKLALNVADEKLEGTIYVIPARLDECVVPDPLNKYQSVDLFGDTDKGYGKIKQALKTTPALPEIALANSKNTYLLNEHDDLLEEYHKLLKQLSVEMERLEEKKNEYEAYHILYIQRFSKYLLEQKDLQIECEALLNTIQKLQYISKYKVHYVELIETTCGMPLSQLLTDHLVDTLPHEACNYEFRCQGKELYVAALSPKKFFVSKYSYPSSLLSLTILNNATLALETEKKVLFFDLKVRKFQLEEIKNLLDVSEPRNQYEQEKNNINDCVSIKVDEPLLGKEQIDEMKRMYKEIMMCTHPDVYGGEYPKDWSAQKIEEFSQIVRNSITAYKSFDIETLRQVHETIKGEDILRKELDSRQEDDKISYLQKKIAWYKERIQAIKLKIYEIQNSDIYGFKNVLQNPEKRNETEQKLKEANLQLGVKANDLREELERLFNSYRSQVENG